MTEEIVHGKIAFRQMIKHSKFLENLPHAIRQKKSAVVPIRGRRKEKYTLKTRVHCAHNADL